MIQLHIRLICSSHNYMDDRKQWEGMFLQHKTYNDADAASKQSTKSNRELLQPTPPSLRSLRPSTLRRKYATLFHFRETDNPSSRNQLPTNNGSCSSHQLSNGRIMQNRQSKLHQFF